MRHRFHGAARRTLLAASLAVLPLAASTARADNVHVSLPFEKYTLENGLEVILHADHRTPIVAVNIWYHVGSKDEPAGKNGFAHLFEHVMFQGSRTSAKTVLQVPRARRRERPERDHEQRPDELLRDRPPGALPLALWLESDRMGFLLDHVEPGDVREPARRGEERAAPELRERPVRAGRQFIQAASFPRSHPYHLSPSGPPQDLDAASLDDVRAFFKTFYVPEQRHAGHRRRLRSAPPRRSSSRSTSRPSRAAGRSAEVKTTRSRSPLDGEKRSTCRPRWSCRASIIDLADPARVHDGGRAARLAAHVLAKGKSSRLYKRLVYDLQIAQDVSAYQDPVSSRAPSKFRPPSRRGRTRPRS